MISVILMNKYQTIAAVMCDITNDIVNESLCTFYNIELGEINLTTRIGSGLATYCKHERSCDKYTITYGKKMIESKFNPLEAKKWLTYREIIKYNYYNANPALSNILAHTICHEFSHLIQQHRKHIKRGSIHNTAFYEILSNFHESGIVKEIHSRLIEKCANEDITLAFNEVTHDNVINNNIEFFINDEISFQHKNKKVFGRVIKINKKTLIIRTKNFLKTSHWKVSKQLVDITPNQ